MRNALGLAGIDFIEFSSEDSNRLHKLFAEFGFSKIARHKDKSIELYKQADIKFVLNHEPGSFGDSFQKLHGPSISAMGWRFHDANKAYELALARGAKPCTVGDYKRIDGSAIPAVYGIGGSLIYFVDTRRPLEFEKLQDPMMVPEKGFLLLDHLTNNVQKGTMQEWANFYRNIFDFQDVRYFDIKGEKTGLSSFALRSPCGHFCIPINEADEAKSQINEFLDEYRGPGVQHLAFLTRDLVSSLQMLKGSSIETLDISAGYYEKAFARVPRIKENRQLIQDLNILVDGDEKGYLLQIFTKKIIGPIFIELIQRENHLSFGEGNFQALFDSIERDQIKRGVL